MKIFQQAKWQVKVTCGLLMWPLMLFADLASEKQAVSVMLGELVDGARVATSRNDGEVVVLNLDSFKGQVLGSFPGGGKFGKISRLWWSPDATQLVFSHEARGYLVDVASGEVVQTLKDQPVVQSPTWWRDPATGEDCLTFMDRNEKDWYRPGTSSPGSTYLYRMKEQAIVTLADFPCDGGLSLDGTHLADAYGGCLLIDLPNSDYRVLNRGRQACNITLSPDSRYQVMHLFLPHDRFGIRNKYDEVLWDIEKPAGSGEWQTPRWSNHPDFCMATAKYGADYKLVLIKISTKEMAVLQNVSGSFRAPQLWLNLPDKLVSEQEIMTEEEGVALYIKAMESEAMVAKPVFERLVDHFGDRGVGAKSVKELRSARFGAKLEAEKTLEKIRDRLQKLRPSKDGNSIYNNPSFFNRNQATLVQLIGLIAEMKKRFPASDTLALAKRETAFLELPEVSLAEGNVVVEAEVTITGVSTVPAYDQIAPYSAVLTWMEARVDRVISGALEDPEIMIVQWGMQDTQHTAAAMLKPGARLRLKMDLFDAHPELARISRAQEAFEDILLNEYWVLESNLVP